MTLADLINDLKKQTEGKDFSLYYMNQIIEERTVFPKGFENPDFKSENMNSGMDMGDFPLYHVCFSAFYKQSVRDTQPILDKFFKMAGYLRFEKGYAEAKYSLFWTPEEFQDEIKLKSLFFNEITLKSRAYSCDPTKVRIGMWKQSHEIEATTKANIMKLKADGNYRKQLERLVKELNIQYAKVNLSREDAERLLRANKNKPIGKYFVRELERILQPKKRQTIVFSFPGIVNFDEQDIIELSIGTKYLPQCEEDIGKSLVDVPAKQESRVTEFIKYYWLRGLLRGERLSDLQVLARDITQMDLGIMYNHPVLTNEDARKLLEKETEIISNGYTNELFGLGINSHLWMGGVVKNLASDHFGAEIIERFDKTSKEEGIKILISLGYIPSGDFNGLDYIAKERHLLECFKQSYAKSPRDSIQNFRNCYKNHEPEMEIFTEEIKKDVTGLRRARLPSRAKLNSLGISKKIGLGKQGNLHWNDLCLSRTLPSCDKSRFYLRASLDSPILLELQENVCREIGIRFI